MKKVFLPITILLTVVLAFSFKSYVDSRVRTDIKDNVKKYNELLIKSVKDLKENDVENKEIIDDIIIFTGKYNVVNTSRKEKDLLSGLTSLSLDYMQMVNAKKDNKPEVFNTCYSKFENSSSSLSSYFKK